MSVIKKGAYRFNNELTIPSGLSGELVIPINYTTRYLFDYDGTTLVPIYTSCDLNTITISIQDGILSVKESYIENGGALREFVCYTDGVGWNVQASMHETMGYTNSALAKGFGQIINVADDTVIDNEIVAVLFYINAKTKMFTKLNVGETVYSSGGKGFKRLTPFVPFTVTADNRGMIGYTDSTTALNIPETFQGQDEVRYKIVAIDSSAFRDCDNLTSVVIPDSVTSIGDYAFYNCDNLTSVVIGNGVITVGRAAFSDCDNIDSLVIGSSVTTVGSYGFDSLIKKVYITDVKAWCNISFPNDNYNVNYTDANPLEGADLYLNGELVTELIIPDDVTTIKNYAFYGCKSITSVVIGDGVRSIGRNVFYLCSNLTSIEFGKCSPSVSYHPFPSSLKDVYITDIEAWCKIQYVAGTSHPLDDGANLYLNGELVTDVTIPNTATTIRSYAFYNCTSLTSIVIPDSVTSIGEEVFNNCTSLTSIKVDANNLRYKDVDGTLYSKNGEKVIRFAQGKSDTSFAIPNGVTSISAGAFRGCASLTSIVIPDGVTSIGDGAFHSCKSLRSITIPGSVRSFGEVVFGSCSSLTSVVLCDGVTRIGEETFNACKSLRSIVIPDSLTRIDGWAFNGCSNFSIKYRGTQAQWNAISKHSSWNTFASNYTITYNNTGD